MTIVGKLLGHPQKTPFDGGKVWVGEVDRGRWEIEVDRDSLNVKCFSNYDTCILEKRMAPAFRQEILTENRLRHEEVILHQKKKRRRFRRSITKGMSQALKAVDKFGREYTANLFYEIDPEQLRVFEPNRRAHAVINYGGALKFEVETKGAIFQGQRQPLELMQIMNPLCSACEIEVALPKISETGEKVINDVEQFFDGSGVELKPITLKEKVKCEFCGNEIVATLRITPNLPKHASVGEVVKAFKTWKNRRTS